MAVYRVHKTENYTVMSNYHLRDKGLSLAARGLLSTILSLPSDWKYSVTGLAAICKEGERAVRSAIDELKERGYIVVTKVSPHEGHNRISYVYDIYETPLFGDFSEKPQVAEGGGCEGVHGEAFTANGFSGAPILNTNNKDTSGIGFSGFEEYQGVGPTTCNVTGSWDVAPQPFVPPTLEEVRSYCEGNLLRKCNPTLFFAYYASQGWRKANGLPVADWKQLAVFWDEQDRNSEAARFVKSRTGQDFTEFSSEKWGRL